MKTLNHLSFTLYVQYPSVTAKLADFERITKDDYLELLRKYGFHTQHTQRHLF